MKLRRTLPATVGIRRLAAIALFCSVSIFVTGCSPASDAAATDDVQIALSPGQVSAAGFGEFSFTALDGKVLDVQFYRASSFKSPDDPIWFVMHGASRDAERYIELAAPVAERHGAIALTIRFPKFYYKRSGDYTLGLTTAGRADGRALREGRWKAPELYLYNEVERVFDAVRDATGGQQRGYYMYGHSAGAQFTHRLLTFMPEHRVLRAVAANAGWYTLPLRGSGGAQTIPYGLTHTPVDEAMRRRLMQAPLTILVGERDIATPAESSMVLDTPAAMAQGRNRYERAHAYFAAGQEAAGELGADLRWNFAVVPRARHSARQMVTSAANYLFNDEPGSCIPTAATAAAGLQITEILADPPSDISGDANRDAVRDSNADEFIELTNTSTDTICLAGWVIGDASKIERHMFPLGTELAAGGTLVVFGGGRPTGQFGNALVQWAAFDGKLSLTNAGDVITLRDADNKIVDQVSWGDCAAQGCADQHYPASLNIARSIVRSPATDREWQPSIGDRLFTPGEIPTSVDRNHLSGLADTQEHDDQST